MQICSQQPCSDVQLKVQPAREPDGQTPPGAAGVQIGMPPQHGSTQYCVAPHCAQPSPPAPAAPALPPRAPEPAPPPFPDWAPPLPESVPPSPASPPPSPEAAPAPLEPAALLPPWALPPEPAPPAVVSVPACPPLASPAPPLPAEARPPFAADESSELPQPTIAEKPPHASRRAAPIERCVTRVMVRTIPLIEARFVPPLDRAKSSRLQPRSRVAPCASLGHSRARRAIDIRLRAAPRRTQAADRQARPRYIPRSRWGAAADASRSAAHLLGFSALRRARAS
jgi:hypothetical protein